MGGGEGGKGGERASTAVHLAKNRLREVGRGLWRGLLEQAAGVLLVEELEVVEAQRRAEAAGVRGVEEERGAVGVTLAMSEEGRGGSSLCAGEHARRACGCSA